LLVRPFVADDLQALHRIYEDAEAMRYVDGSYPDLDATRAALEMHITMQREHGFAFWAVLREDELIGEVGFGRMGDEIEMGWFIRRDNWGHGYATEAASAALEHAPGPVIAVIRPDNAASIRVAEKLGFVLRGAEEVRGNRQLIYTQGANVQE
jgi:RimJ/RimL family protein N-acetyltransferase